MPSFIKSVVDMMTQLRSIQPQYKFQTLEIDAAKKDAVGLAKELKQVQRATKDLFLTYTVSAVNEIQLKFQHDDPKQLYKAKQAYSVDKHRHSKLKTIPLDNIKLVPFSIVQQAQGLVIEHTADQQQMPVIAVQQETSLPSLETDGTALKIRKKSPQKFSTINEAKLNRLKQYLTRIDKVKGLEWYTDIYKLSSDRSIDRIIQVLVPILTPGKHA